MISYPSDSVQVLKISLKEDLLRYTNFAESISTLSQHLNDTSLKVLAGSIIILLGSDYVKPIYSKSKLIYLLFIPAWISLSFSFYYSDVVNRIAASVASFKYVEDIKSLIFDDGGINEMYGKQSKAFFIGMVFLSLWLLSYLIWWIFIDKSTKQKTK